MLLYSYLDRMNYEMLTDWALEEKKFRTITDKQYKLLQTYANKAKLSVEQLVDWVENGKVSFSEITQGILWVRLD